MTAMQAFPEGAQIYDLWISPQGNLWVAADSGLYVGFPEQGGAFAHGYNEPFKQIIGIQQEPYTIWALGVDGTTIHAFRGDHWAVYGAKEGWEPFGGEIGIDPPAVTSDGVVWLATGADDLRRFDSVSDTWSSLQAVNLGFSPADPNYQGHYLTDALISPDGSLWVSDCIGMGEAFTGQGVRYYREGVWNAVPRTEGQCVFDLERDAEGRIWVSARDLLLVYDSISGSWSEISPPQWDRPQYILDVSFDSLGTLWISTLLCGGASCDTVAYFSYQGNLWLPRFKTEAYYYPAPGINFAADASAWLCWNGIVYQQEPDRLIEIGMLQTSSCKLVVDSDGMVWLGAFDGPDAGLWQVAP
jgi:hypothetical protein